jgi:hypothetical protein
MLSLELCVPFPLQQPLLLRLRLGLISSIVWARRLGGSWTSVKLRIVVSFLQVDM